jgi:hypothetical protein
MAAGGFLAVLTILLISGCSYFGGSASDDPPAPSASGSSIALASGAQSASGGGATQSATQVASNAAEVPVVTSGGLADTPVFGDSKPGTPVSAAAPSTKPAVVVASKSPAVLKGLEGAGMQNTAQKLNPVMMRALKQFQIASAKFPDFCRDWSHKLSVREHDNIEHIRWTKHDGVETGSYVGYSPIESCTCKEASNGVAVGVLTYHQFDYTLSGKSVTEAKRAAPHAVSVTPTREIFAYDKGKWFW